MDGHCWDGEKLGSWPSCFHWLNKGEYRFGDEILTLNLNNFLRTLREYNVGNYFTYGLFS